MKIAITGALGHIGSGLIHSLRPGAYERVLLLDNLSSQRFNSLFRLPDGVPFHFVQDDVCDGNLRAHFSGMDAVIHLAAITDAAASFEMEDQVQRVNFEGSLAVARACAECGSRLLFLSTTSVYGTQDELVDENCPVSSLRPQSPYAASKLRAEQELEEMGRNGSLSYSIYRFGTIFGVSPGMRFHTAINKFVWQACLGVPITVWRTALHQKRPYLALQDAVASIDFFLREPRADAATYNVVTANATVSDIVEMIRRHVPDLTVEYVDSPIMNQLSYAVASDKFQALGFEFKGDLRQGIAETVAWIRNARCSVPGT